MLDFIMELIEKLRNVYKDILKELYEIQIQEIFRQFAVRTLCRKSYVYDLRCTPMLSDANSYSY